MKNVLELAELMEYLRVWVCSVQTWRVPSGYHWWPAYHRWRHRFWTDLLWLTPYSECRPIGLRSRRLSVKLGWASSVVCPPRGHLWAQTEAALNWFRLLWAELPVHRSGNRALPELLRHWRCSSAESWLTVRLMTGQRIRLTQPTSGRRYSAIGFCAGFGLKATIVWVEDN